MATADPHRACVCIGAARPPSLGTEVAVPRQLEGSGREGEIGLLHITIFPPAPLQPTPRHGLLCSSPDTKIP
ncbi:hypothetical protein chiPu_0004094 [Chiloscyllium punctatum]|uniref:Uncharacterized protein n=1 Tax=Chiloscyllium punctatum TaxID=137246 RepID=A0A401S5K2_CHIPU|nr:hypothetical protein [Chiloscyllium punctatum]